MQGNFYIKKQVKKTQRNHQRYSKKQPGRSVIKIFEKKIVKEFFFNEFATLHNAALVKN